MRPLTIACMLGTLVFASQICALPVVSVDATTKVINADPPLVAHNVILRGKEYRISFYNGGSSPVTAVLKITGLTGKSYDCYEFGTFKGTLPTETLINGFEIKLPGSAISSKDAAIFEALRGPLNDATALMGTDLKAWPLCYDFARAAKRANFVLDTDRTLREMSVTILESGKATMPQIFLNDITPTELNRRVRLILQDYERQRKTVIGSKMPPEKIAQQLGWLLPVAISFKPPSVDAPTSLGVLLTNLFDKPVKGLLSLELSGEGKITPTKCSVEIAPGKNQTCLFTLSQVTGLTENWTATLRGTANGSAFVRQVSVKAIPPAGK